MSGVWLIEGADLDRCLAAWTDAMIAQGADAAEAFAEANSVRRFLESPAAGGLRIAVPAVPEPRITVAKGVAS